MIIFMPLNRQQNGDKTKGTHKDYTILSTALTVTVQKEDDEPGH